MIVVMMEVWECAREYSKRGGSDTKVVIVLVRYGYGQRGTLQAVQGYGARVYIKGTQTDKGSVESLIVGCSFVLCHGS
jgi:hypothetical protein